MSDEEMKAAAAVFTELMKIDGPPLDQLRTLARYLAFVYAEHYSVGESTGFAFTYENLSWPKGKHIEVIVRIVE